MICIWCKKNFDKLSIEHVIPEGLACPDELVRTDVACGPCNNSLSRVDRALVKQFELHTVIHRVPRKNGKPPMINSWKGLRSRMGANGPEMFINGGPGAVKVAGETLQPASKKDGVSDVWIKPDEGTAGFRQQFGNDRRFLPAIHKIGLNLIAVCKSPQIAASARYDHIRSFVRLEKDAVHLSAVLEKETIFGAVTGANMVEKAGRQDPMFRIMILGTTFFVDTSPDQSGLRDFRATATMMGEPSYVFPEPVNT